MKIVTPKEVVKAFNLDNYGFLGLLLAKGLLFFTGITQINKFYKKHCKETGVSFLNSVLNYYTIKYSIPEEDLERIPKTGAFIVVSNHPLGAIDGVILLKTFLEKRTDFKLMSNFLLQKLIPLRPYLISVNPFDDKLSNKSSINGIKECLQHLKGGRPVGIFPAGEVSTEKKGKIYLDKQWEPSVMKLIKKAEVPVIPVYFKARNSSLFYKLSSISALLRTAQLPRQISTQKRRKIKVRIGKPIPIKEQSSYTDILEYTNFVRQKTYLLNNSIDEKKFIDIIPSKIKLKRTPKEIAAKGNLSIIESEIESCREIGCRLLQSKNYEVFLTKKEQMPNVLQEIGRLREITYRAIGEGSNKALDLDEFDEYYHHLILWDNKAAEVAGAYRLGLGKHIYESKGIAGFYLQDLFRFAPELHQMMSESIEMGRAFITPEYQQKALPLFLLWKGIIHTTLKFPEHNYLIGGVTISDKFSNFSKSLMVEFMKSHFYDEEIAKYVNPKKEFKVKLNEEDKNFVFSSSNNDINKFDKIIDDLEPSVLRMPVLLKKYVKQNAKVVAFNIDPLFNDVVDGLMYIKITDLPESTVKPVIEELQKEMEKKGYS